VSVRATDLGREGARAGRTLQRIGTEESAPPFRQRLVPEPLELGRRGDVADAPQQIHQLAEDAHRPSRHASLGLSKKTVEGGAEQPAVRSAMTQQPLQQVTGIDHDDAPDGLQHGERNVDLRQKALELQPVLAGDQQHDAFASPDAMGDERAQQVYQLRVLAVEPQEVIARAGLGEQVALQSSVAGMPHPAIVALSTRMSKRNGPHGTTSALHGRESECIYADVEANWSVATAQKRALVLVVERNSLIQRLERFLFEQAGFEVHFVADGISALAIAREKHPDLLITEILVPKLDGLRLCRDLKANPTTRDIRVLVVSALNAGDRAFEAGADDFVGKPLNEERLLGAVERLLRGVARKEEEPWQPA
jgi:CheY-like chemotaxis protein